MDIEHLVLLSWFCREGESHEQDGERLFRSHDPEKACPDLIQGALQLSEKIMRKQLAEQRLAILPWLGSSLWFKGRTGPALRPAASWLAG